MLSACVRVILIYRARMPIPLGDQTDISCQVCVEIVMEMEAGSGGRTPIEGRKSMNP